LPGGEESEGRGKEGRGMYAVKSMSPACFKNWTSADWVVVDGKAKHRVFLVVRDENAPASHCLKALVSILKDFKRAPEPKERTYEASTYPNYV
jgi:hypothetical protein